MGFFSATVSISRYKVTDPLPDNFWNYAIEAVNRHHFSEMDHSLKEINLGWVSPTDPFKSEITLPEISFGNYLILSMRIDERKIPQPVLKKHVLLEERRIMGEKGLKRLSRRIRSEIKDRVRQGLLAKVLPVPKTYDLCMDISDGTVLFMSCKPKAREMLENLFYNTFSMQLDPVIPFTLASSLLTESEFIHYLNKIGPWTWK